MTIDKVSMELEFSILQGDVRKILDIYMNIKNGGLKDEYGTRTLELNISKVSDIQVLNQRTYEAFKEISLYCSPYGGGIVLDLYPFNSDKRAAEISMHTSKTETQRKTDIKIFSLFGGKIHNLTSQQVLLGITDEKHAMDVYNILRQASPITAAMFAASPLEVTDSGLLIPNSHETIRMQKYLEGAELTSTELIETPPFTCLKDIENQMDKSTKDLSRKGLNLGSELKYFHTAPMIRLRQDHSDETDVCSIEVRTPDTPITLSGVYAVNSFFINLGYCVGSNKLSKILSHLDGRFSEHITAGRYGINSEINGVCIYDTARRLIDISREKSEEIGLNPINYQNLEIFMMVLRIHLELKTRNFRPYNFKKIYVRYIFR